MGLFKYIGYGIAVLCFYVTFEYFTLPDVTQIEKCFVTSMNKVNLCPKSGNYVKLSQISSNVKDITSKVVSPLGFFLKKICSSIGCLND